MVDVVPKLKARVWEDGREYAPKQLLVKLVPSDQLQEKAPEAGPDDWWAEMDLVFDLAWRP